MKKLSTDNRDGWYEISPEDAKEILGRQAKNRPVGRRLINRMVRDILRGQWVANGEAVILDADRHLIDGQHRLTACIEADRSIVCYLVHLQQRIGAQVFDTMDQGLVRTTAHRFAMEGVKYYALAAAIARQLLLYEMAEKVKASGGGKGGRGVTNPDRFKFEGVGTGDVRRTYNTHKAEIDEAVDKVAAAGARYKWVSITFLGFVYMMARRVDPKRADSWLHSVITGEGLSAGDPVGMLRKRLQDDAMSRRRPQREEELALLIKSWNLHAHGSKVGLLKWDKREDFPQFVAR